MQQTPLWVLCFWSVVGSVIALISFGVDFPPRLSSLPPLGRSGCQGFPSQGARQVSVSCLGNHGNRAGRSDDRWHFSNRCGTPLNLERSLFPPAPLNVFHQSGQINALISSCLHHHQCFFGLVAECLPLLYVMIKLYHYWPRPQV